jgi:hypothetical protein
MKLSHYEIYYKVGYMKREMFISTMMQLGNLANSVLNSRHQLTQNSTVLTNFYQ